MTTLNAHARTRDPLLSWLEGEAFTVDQPGHRLHGKQVCTREENGLANLGVRRLRLHGLDGKAEVVEMPRATMQAFGSINPRIFDL